MPSTKLPPSMTTNAFYTLVDGPIDAAAVLACVASPARGASLLFLGTVRSAGSRATVRLTYDAYRPMALAEMARIGEEIAMQWPGTACAMAHRLGNVPVGEAAVVIAVASGHRPACYAASRYAIDRLKAAVPIWKKETYADGEALWAPAPAPASVFGEGLSCARYGGSTP